MNTIQRAVLVLGAIAILAVSLFPPWTYTFRYSGRPTAERSAGRHFITAPPEPGDLKALGEMFGLFGSSYGLSLFSTQLNSAVLGFELFCVLLITLLLYFAAGVSRPRVQLK